MVKNIFLPKEKIKMEQMKWELIKRQALKSFFEQTQITRLFDNRNPMYLALLRHSIRCPNNAIDTAETLRDIGEVIIKNWDIRGADKLIELFPASIPKKLRGKKTYSYQANNENSDWMIVFN
jgi:hypothetical protein